MREYSINTGIILFKTSITQDITVFIITAIITLDCYVYYCSYPGQQFDAAQFLITPSI